MTSHFGHGSSKQLVNTGVWYETSAHVTELVNQWSGRSDLSATVGAEATKGVGAPAFFDPRRLEIGVNSTIAFGELPPEFVGDLRERHVQYDYAAATGATVHEAGHARYTTWDLEKAAKDLKYSQNRAMHLLEETRMEGLMGLHLPKMKVFMRNCALTIVLSDMQDEDIAKLSLVRQTAHLAGLSLARVDAGILEESDVAALRKQVTDVLGVDLLAKLRNIWLQFQRITDPGRHIQKMYDLAIEWDKLVQDEAESRGEGEEQQQGQGMGRELSDEEKEAIQDMMDAIGEAMEEAGVGSAGAIVDQQRQEDNEEEAKQRAEQRKEDAEHEDAAAKVFSKSPKEGQVGTNSRLKSTRPPTEEERVAAVIVSRELERAKYRDRTKTRTKSIVPPGRLISNAMVQGTAYRSMGLNSPVEPFRRIQRKQTDEPDLIIGQMTDISGSMGGAMEPMGVTAWVMSEAVRRIQGTTAAVYYGGDVFPTLKPGQHLDKVQIYTAPDGSHRFDKAFKALNGALHLLDGAGARLLVVCSDGAYESVEQDAVAKWLTRCRDQGVGVLWIGFGSDSGWGRDSDAIDYCNSYGATYVNASKGIVDAAMAVGMAAAKALSNASARRSGY